LQEYSASNMFPQPAPGQLSGARMRALTRWQSQARRGGMRRRTGGTGTSTPTSMSRGYVSQDEQRVRMHFQVPRASTDGVRNFVAAM
jgi:hypothetical protein